MHPQALVEAACAKNLDIIAVCDHNTAENTIYVIRAARGKKLKVIPGMEVTTREEVHVVVLMPTLRRTLTLQRHIYRHLSGLNNEALFGVQAVVNERGEVEKINERLLIGATDLSLTSLVESVHALGGLAIASHIDREVFGIIGQLGFVPPKTAFDALEISPALDIAGARRRYPELKRYAFIKSSDAHDLCEIGRASTMMYLAAPTLTEIGSALLDKDGRRIGESP